MKTLRNLSLILSFAAVGLPGAAFADVQLPSIISDHMVLQKSARTALWGTAAPGEEVKITLENLHATARAGADGKWRVNLNLQTLGQGPYQLLVSGSNQITVNDVVVGDVWLASGQSNMEFTLGRTDKAAQEIPNSSNPQLRQFLVRPRGSLKPEDACEGKWEVASPQTSGRFTAVGYYFAKSIQHEMKLPVGLIDSSYGGSNIESWISYEGLDRDPELKSAKDSLCAEEANFPQRKKDYAAQFHAWAAKYGREDHPNADPQQYAAPNLPLDGWKPVTLPGSLAKAGMPESGVVWLRKTITVTKSQDNVYMPLILSLPRDFDTVYFNGIKVGETTPEKSTSANTSAKSSNYRRYDVPATLVKAGEVTIAIRLVSPGGSAGIDNGGMNAAGTNLSGEWMAKVETELPPLSAEALAAYPAMPLTPPVVRSMPGQLYNAMVHPIQDYGIKGVIWYQGETNGSLGYQYRTTFPLLIQDWRRIYQQNDLPFYWCQLANFMSKNPQPAASDWAELREAQTMTLKLPATGQAILIDLGEENDVHSRNKADVGERLAKVALAKTYGKPIPFSGPVYRSMNVEGNKIRVHFDFAEGLAAQPLPATYVPRSLEPTVTKPLVLNSPESQVQGFAICGADQKFVWANAVIEGNSVVVSAPGVHSPVAVRYAWASNPTCNLINKVGLPAGPFRTDDFPLNSFARRYGK